MATDNSAADTNGQRHFYRTSLGVSSAAGPLFSTGSWVLSTAELVTSRSRAVVNVAAEGEVATRVPFPGPS